ncbi:MAG: hypothetical protein ABR941_06790, partial [Thermoleophilia bacterium]
GPVWGGVVGRRGAGAGGAARGGRAGAACAAAGGTTWSCAPHVQALGAGATISVAGGARDSYIVRPDGSLWSFGGNIYGELGIGNLAPSFVPAPVGGADWSMVASGRGGHVVMAIKTDGTLWAWGNADLGPLLSTSSFDAPAQVGTDSDWASVAVGEEFAIAIKTDGTLWAWGVNDKGQLGTGSTTASPSSFTQIGTDKWTQAACGFDSTVAIRQDGSLWSWGDNNLGQLGLGTHDNNAHATPTQVGTANDWATIGCGWYFTLAVKTDGTLWAWGENDDGQIGQGGQSGEYGGTPEFDSPVRVGADSDWSTTVGSLGGGSWHSVALKQDGTLWGWGSNGYGALGVGLQSHEFGQTDTTTPTQIDASTDWQAVTAGDTFTLAEKQDGSYVAWGDNQFGQIGVGYPLERCTPTQIGSDPGWTSVATGYWNTIAARSDGTLWNWYANSRTPAQVGSARDWATAFAGNRYFLALKADGTLWSWSDSDGNSYGELGLGDTAPHETPTQVGTATDWTTVTCGDNVLADGEMAQDDSGHTVALRSDGTLWAWGSNTNGELGLGTADNSPHATPTQVGAGTDWQAIAAGPHCTFAIKTNGTLWAWGKNTDGRLGLGDTVDRDLPTQVGADRNWKTVTAGADSDQGFTLATKTDGTLWAWGSNVDGALGTGNYDSETSPTQVGADTDWASVATGGNISCGHTLAIKTDGSLWAWGEDFFGELGTGNYANQIVPTRVGADTDWSALNCTDDSYAIRSDGTLWAWGPNDESQLGLGDPLWHPQPVDLVLTTVPDTTPPTVTAIPALQLSPLFGGPAVTAGVTAAGAASPGKAAAGWYRAPVKIGLSATDGGWGVARTQYSLNGAIGWLTADSVTVSNNGKTTVTYNAVDRAGNAAALKTITVHVDKVKPVPKALNVIRTSRGAWFTLKLKVTDKWSPTCAVTIVVKKGAHKVKTFALGRLKTGRTLRHRLRCRLRTGSYRWYVYATDLAGNRQTKVSSSRLTVR